MVIILKTLSFCVWRRLEKFDFKHIFEKTFENKSPWEAIDEKRDSLPAPQENFQLETHEKRQRAAVAMQAWCAIENALKPPGENTHQATAIKISEILA